MVAKNPALLQWINAAPVDTEKLKALDMGTALHCKLLEPEEFSKRFILAPEFNRRTTAGKEAEAAFLKDCEHTGKTVMDAEQGRKLQLMRDSVMAHPAARWLLEAEGHCESSFYWTDPETGELCRCRPDRYLSDHPVIVDVKKVADMDRFARHIEEFRYHVQMPCTAMDSSMSPEKLPDFSSWLSARRSTAAATRYAFLNSTQQT